MVPASVTLIALLLLPPATSAAPRGQSAARGWVAEVRIAAEASAPGDRLTLGDIAQIRSEAPAVAEQLRKVALGYAPNVGAVREITREKVSLAIAAAGFASGAVKLVAPAVALVRRASQGVDPVGVREAVERALLTDLRAAGAAARLVRLDLPTNIELPSGAVEIRASATGARDLLAPFSVIVEFWVDGRVTRRLSATAQAEAFAPVLVAARDIAAGSRVRAEDVKVETVRLERPPSLYLKEAATLRGYSARVAVAGGEPLTRDLLAAEIVVRPGEAVSIIGESGKMSIAVQGEARAAGRVGDRIQVRNNGSGALIQAQVVDEGKVRVNF